MREVTEESCGNLEQRLIIVFVQQSYNYAVHVLTRGRLLALLRKQIVIIAWDDGGGASRPNEHSIQCPRNSLKIRLEQTRIFPEKLNDQRFTILQL